MTALGTPRVARIVALLLRVALGVAFLSSVADRFGLWGPPGRQAHGTVYWGSFGAFVTYTGRLNPAAPSALVPMLAWAATMLETVLGFALLLGIRTRLAAAGAAGLLTLFALAMTTSTGVKSPLDFSVWSAATGAALLASAGVLDPWSVDAFARRLIARTKRGAR
jgi:uncharacterized membrane protein YphA (DoxX/SURF4 family)